MAIDFKKINLNVASVFVLAATIVIANADKFTEQDVVNARKILEELAAPMLDMMGVKF